MSTTVCVWWMHSLVAAIVFVPVSTLKRDTDTLKTRASELNGRFNESIQTIKVN